ncbi:MAG: LysR family transcriptional regulator [Mesorhizobium sp.]|nr:MAG: LysR family transcriptional regulator [Mesorhizobium sp.]
MRLDQFSGIVAFVKVAEAKSFTRAAAELGVAPASLSEAVKGLEERLGVRLLNRTTRSVSPTAAGETLFARLAPAFSELEGAVADAHASRDRPAGSLRINVPRIAAMRFIVPILGDFRRAYPDIALTIIVDDMLTDIVEGRFDAGIRLGERLHKDGVGVAYMLDYQVRPWIETGKLIRFLEAWSPRFPGFYLYHTSSRQVPPALRVFIDFLLARR